MINLMYADRKWPRPEPRDALLDARWAVFSIGAALILLPAIGIKRLSRAVVPARERETEMIPYLYAAVVIAPHRSARGVAPGPRLFQLVAANKLSL